MWSKWACALAISSMALSAQETRGSISGVVADPSDAVIPHALISVANSSKLETRSGSSGEFVLRGLEPGVYDLKFESPGFKVKELGVPVEEGKETTLGLVLLDILPLQPCLGPAHKSQTSRRKLPSGGAPRILGEARGDDGRVWKDLAVRLLTVAAKLVHESKTNENGEFQILGVAPGVYDLEISQGETSLILIRALRVPSGYEVKVRVKWAPPQICL